jgi:hypothetical protein
MDQRSLMLRAVKTFHTIAWLVIEACMAYVLYSGITGRNDRKARVAAVVVASESLIFAGTGFQCPLTVVARNLGDGSGSVTDIYLPRWLAKVLPGMHVPLILVAVLLHWRNWRKQTVRESERRLLLGR